jgi:hypothetical protein
VLLLAMEDMADPVVVMMLVLVLLVAVRRLTVTRTHFSRNIQVTVVQLIVPSFVFVFAMEDMADPVVVMMLVLVLLVAVRMLAGAVVALIVFIVTVLLLAMEDMPDPVVVMMLVLVLLVAVRRLTVTRTHFSRNIQVTVVQLIVPSFVFVFAMEDVANPVVVMMLVLVILVVATLTVTDITPQDRVIMPTMMSVVSMRMFVFVMLVFGILTGTGTTVGAVVRLGRPMRVIQTCRGMVVPSRRVLRLLPRSDLFLIKFVVGIVNIIIFHWTWDRRKGHRHSRRRA